MSAWQSIETAPKDGGWILARLKGSMPQITRWGRHHHNHGFSPIIGWTTAFGYAEFDEWHPLPEEGK